MKQKTCKICKEKYTPLRQLQQVCSPKCAIEYQNKQKQKAHDKYWDAKKKQHNQDNSNESLQKSINKLVRLIDERFYQNCICCDRYLKYHEAGSVHAAHRYNVGGHENIRWNLHDIHSATLYCNKHNTEHKTGYDKGLVLRYGLEYKEMVDGLDLKYKVLKPTTKEIKEKIKIVNKIIRDFDTFILQDGKQAREMFNNLIGIYK